MLTFTLRALCFFFLCSHQQLLSICRTYGATKVSASEQREKKPEVWLLLNSAHLYTGQVSVLRCYMDSSVSIVVDFVQRDGLFLHELKQPQQDLLLERQTGEKKVSFLCV